MKRIILIICLLLVFIEHSECQVVTKSQVEKSYSNIVKKIIFLSQNQYYPLTVLLCPFGYWEYGQIRYGFNNYHNIEYLRNNHFGWTHNGNNIETPSNYKYDTIQADTIYSLFNNLMCKEDPCNLIDDINDASNVHLSSNFINDFKYTYLLKNIPYHSEHNNIIIIYSTLSKNGYKEHFNTIIIELFIDSIKITSYKINTVNLFDIQYEKMGSIILTGKQKNKLNNKISNVNLNKTIDCSACNQSPKDQFNYIVIYNNKNHHNAYFLCDLLYVRNKKQDKITENLEGLKNYVIHLNQKYFLSKK